MISGFHGFPQSPRAKVGRDNVSNYATTATFHTLYNFAFILSCHMMLCNLSCCHVVKCEPCFLLGWLRSSPMQVNVNFGQHRTTVTLRKHYCYHLYLSIVTRCKMATSPESTIGKKVRYHNACLRVLVRPAPLGTRSLQ
jgi:hypothetical protein